MLSMHKNAQNQNLHDANCPCDGRSSRPHSQLIPAIRDAQCPIHNPEVAVIEVSEEQGSHTAGNCSEYRTDRVRSNQYRSCDTCRRGHSNRTRSLNKTHQRGNCKRQQNERYIASSQPISNVSTQTRISDDAAKCTPMPPLSRAWRWALGWSCGRESPL